MARQEQRRTEPNRTNREKGKPMKERPILFSGEMVRAILEGRKTQTRRVVSFPQYWKDNKITHGDLEKSGFWVSWNGREHRWQYGDDYLPQNYQVGDRLWVRETIRGRKIPGLYTGGYPTNIINLSGATYQADLTPVMGDGPNGHYLGRALCEWKWKSEILPSIFMPRWASRLTLEIKSVRVERVKDISEEDAKAEGIVAEDGHLFRPLGSKEPEHPITHRELFEGLWNSINAKRGFGWDVNPWMFVIEFEKVNA